MADSDFGQLWAEILMKNEASPEIRKIIDDFKALDNTIMGVKKSLAGMGKIKFVESDSDKFEKQWRTVRGALVDIDTMITKVNQKMAENKGLGLDVSGYETELKRLKQLKDELTTASKGDMFINSSDVQRFTQEFGIIKKEVANVDAQSKELVNTQKQNVAAVEQMVAAYGKMSTALSSARQGALDSGMVPNATQYAQNYVNYIQQTIQKLQTMISDPALLTGNAMNKLQQQFERISANVASQIQGIQSKVSAENILKNSDEALLKWMTNLKRMQERLKEIQGTKLKIDTSSMQTAISNLSQFLNNFKAAIAKGNITKGDAANFAHQYTMLAEAAKQAKLEVEGLFKAEQQRIAADRSSGARSSARAAQETAQVYRQVVQAMDPVIAKMRQLQDATTRTGRVWEQFKTQIAFTAFSIYGIEHFLKNVITIGGEFERQRVALQNMLGDMREANEIFGQLKNLALESPFTFRQLSTYTKQLAAFSIPYEELYDTNRRLSDMSAGLGVDMSRLILAYGQVRAATVLRGQELRQFTEAGVPMVEKLADYFTKLNGELVTTRDIFKMITLKQVPFEAVRSVMQEMTDEGGMFYNMQAKIADTLSGRWGNLKDAWEILLGEIADGDSLVGKLLKTSVEGLTDVIRNLSTILGVIGGLGVGKAVASLGFFGMGSLGIGSLPIEREFLQAKKLAAIDLQRQAITRELKDEEKDILRYKNQITEADYKALALSGSVDKYQMAILYKKKQISREMMEQVLLAQGVYMEEVKRLQNMSRMQLAMHRIGAQMKAMFWNPTTAITAGIMAIGALVGSLIQHFHKLDELRVSVAEQALQSRLDLSEFMSNNPLKDEMDTAEAKRAIEKYSEELKKVSPNFLEIKSRIVGEHGESPQEQAKAYRDELQKVLDNSDVSEFISRRTVENDNRGIWRDTFAEKANAYYKEISGLNDEIMRLDPMKFKAMVNSMEGLNDATKEQINLLITQGKKLEALRRIKEATDKIGPTRVDYQDDDFYVAYTDIFNRLFFDTDKKTEYKDAADDFFSSMKKDIVDSYSNAFDKDGKWIGGEDLKSSLIKGIRDALSELGASDDAMNGILMEFERIVFGSSSSTAVDYLVSTFLKKRPELAKQLKDSGGVITDEVEAGLEEVARDLATKDANFMENVNYLLNGKGKNEVHKRIKIVIDEDKEELEAWQQSLVNDFGEDYKAVIKASPDIPSALDAATKLYKEAKEKVASFKSLKLGIGFEFDGLTPIDKDKVGYYVLAPAVQEAIDQYNSFIGIISSFQSNKDKYGISDTDTNKTKKTGGRGRKEDAQLREWKNHVDLYKKFLDQYRKLTEMYGQKKALDELMDDKAYEWVINFARGKGVDPTDVSAMNNYLSKALNTNAGDKQKRRDAIAKRTADLEAEGYEREREALERLNDELKEQLQILNDQYDAYEKIFLITGNKEGSMQLAFGGMVTNERFVDELTEQLQNALKKVGSKVSVDEALGLTKEQINNIFGEKSVVAARINDLKEERNKLEKEYIDILANALTSDQSLEEKRAEAIRKHNEQLRKLMEMRKSATDQDVVDKAIESEKNRSRREIADYEQRILERDTNIGGLMSNLSVLSDLQIDGLITQLQHIAKLYEGDKTTEGIAALNRLNEQISKLRDELSSRKLGEMFKDAFSNRDPEGLEIGENGQYRVRGALAARYNMTDGYEITFDTAERIKSAEKLRKLTTAIEGASNAFKSLQDILQPVIDLLDALGMEDTPFGQAMSGASSALSAAGGTAGAFSNLVKVAGADTPLGSLLSKAGPYGAAAAAALSVATSIFQLHDKALQKEIEASEQRQKEMENLSTNLETVLERTLGSIYATSMTSESRNKFSSIVGGTASMRDSGLNFFEWVDAAKQAKIYTEETIQAMKDALNSDTFYDANYASLLAQRDEMQHQLDLEREKKKSDDSVISDLEQQLIEMDDMIKYYAEDMAKELYDIDVKSWADELASAIVDAWAAGEDAVEAYKKKVNEIMRSLVTNIIAKKFIETALKRARVDEIIEEQMTNTSGRLNEFSVTAIGNALTSATDEAVSNATKLLDYLKSVGWDLSDTADDASTLGKGIASITEDTADLLASYINAIRADVAAMRALEERAIESGFFDVNNNLTLQLTELRNISSFAERNAMAAEQILELFNSVTTVGSSGRKVRV